MTTILRAAAIMIALLALIDPALAVKRTAPLPVEVLLPSASDPAYPAASDTARRIADSLGDRITTSSAEPPLARLSLGGALPPDLSVPTIALVSEPPSGVTIADAEVAPTVHGQPIEVTAVLSGAGGDGQKSTITLMDRGVVVARAEHSWAAATNHARVRLSYAAPSNGLVPLTVRVETPGVEPTAADLAAAVSSRPLRVLVYEPRPSWAAAFVRRALEAEARFTVAGLSRSAPRIATRVGTAPPSLDAVAPGDFDVVAIGAPEALLPAELTFLDRFASMRGGTVLLLPDTRLSASVHEKFGLPKMEEKLLNTPVDLPSGVRASELLLPAASRSVGAIASVSVDGTARAAIFSVPHGDGTVVLSGLMDAWRYRRAAADRYWQGLVADLASAVPPPLDVRVRPALARPGDRIHVTASWRRDLIEGGNDVRVPATRATVTDAGGQATAVRLWPGDRAGVYEAWLDAPAAGEYKIAVAGSGIAAEAMLRTADTVRHPSAGSASPASIAALSGGGTARDLQQAREQLERFPAPEVEESARPMRSPWWIVPFAGCLCAEWLIRRKQGLR